jgi:hypothetical protein
MTPATILREHDKGLNQVVVPLKTARRALARACLGVGRAEFTFGDTSEQGFLTKNFRGAGGEKGEEGEGKREEGE